MANITRVDAVFLQSDNYFYTVCVGAATIYLRAAAGGIYFFGKPMDINENRLKYVQVRQAKVHTGKTARPGATESFMLLGRHDSTSCSYR